MSDLRSKPLIVAKGLLFLLMIGLCLVILLAQSPTLATTLAALMLIWASARFYYFLFYVLHAYVDPGLRYAGLIDMIKRLLGGRRQPPPGAGC